MTQYLRTKDAVNMYIEFNHLRSLNEYLTSNSKIFYSNISSKKSEVLHYLREYSLLAKEKERVYANGNKPRNGYVFDVMLPKILEINETRKKLQKYIRDLVKNVSEGNKLKYFAVITKYGSANMLRIVILDRVYYPESKEVEYVRNNIKKSKVIFITTKIRLNYFATKCKNSKQLFILKINELKLMFLNLLGQNIKEVQFFFKKITYKKLFCEAGLNNYYYIDEHLDQRNKYIELKKRKITTINVLIHELNQHIANILINADCEAFREKWYKVIQDLKRAKINEILTVESKVVEYISTLNF